MITRRDCLKQGGAAAAALAVTGCSQWTRALHEPPGDLTGALHDGTGASPAKNDAVLRRTLNRAGFGPLPGDRERVGAMGVDAYLEEQLHPERLEEGPALAWRLWQLDSLQADTDFRYDLSGSSSLSSGSSSFHY